MNVKVAYLINNLKAEEREIYMRISEKVNIRQDYTKLI